jgi:chaperonin cofactor prefoldin
LYNFDGHALTFALINSVKELSAKIESLETKIQTLENQ